MKSLPSRWRVVRTGLALAPILLAADRPLRVIHCCYANPAHNQPETAPYLLG